MHAQRKRRRRSEFKRRDSSHSVPSLEFKFAFKTPEPRYGRIITARDELGRIVSSKSPQVSDIIQIFYLVDVTPSHLQNLCYTFSMNLISTDELIRYFYSKGGSISDVYLNTPDTVTPNHASVVFLNGKFHVGDTTREAIIKALKLKSNISSLSLQ